MTRIGGRPANWNAAIGAATGLAKSQIYALAANVPPRRAPLADPVLDACCRVVGDERFWALSDRDARTVDPRWWRYRGRA